MIEETPKNPEITSETDFKQRAEAFASLHATLDTPKQTLREINDSIGEKSVTEMAESFPRFMELETLNAYIKENKLKKPTKIVKLITKIYEKVVKVSSDVPDKWTKTKAKDMGKKILKTGIYVDILETIQNIIFPTEVEPVEGEMAEEVTENTTEESKTTKKTGSKKKPATKKEKKTKAKKTKAKKEKAVKAETKPLVKRSKRGRKKNIYTTTVEEIRRILDSDNLEFLSEEGNDEDTQLTREVGQLVKDSQETVNTILAGYEAEGEKTISEFNYSQVIGWLNTLKELRVNITELSTLDNKINLYEMINGITAKILKKSNMDIENETIVAKTVRGLTQAINNGVRDKIYKDVGATISSINEFMTEINYEDAELTEALNLYEPLTWINKAQQSLKKKSNTMSVFEAIVKDAPEAVKESEIYTQVVSRSKGRNIIMSETDIQSKIQEFLDEDNITDLSERIYLFINDCRSIKIDEKCERLINLLEKTTQIFTDQDFTNIDSIQEELFEYKLYENKTFKNIEDIKKRIEHVNQTKGQIQANKNKLKRKIEILEKKSNNSLDILKQIDRFDITQASSMLTELEGLNKGLKSMYKQDIDSLKSQISTSKAFSKQLATFRKQYSVPKLLANKASIESEQLFKDFEILVKSYLEINFASEPVNKEIENYTSIMRAVALVRGATFMNTDTHLTTWKRVLNNIEGSKTSKGALITTMKKKINLALKFDKQVKEIKSCVGKSRSDRKAFVKLSEAKELLEDINKNCSEMNLGNNKSYLESTINSIQGKLENIESDEALMLHELQNNLEFFKRAPLDLQTEIQGLIDKEMNASEFLQQVRQLSPEGFMSAQQNLQDKYDNLGVKVMEWEDMITSVKREEQTVGDIQVAIEEGITDLNHCIQIRDKYKSNVKFMKDLKMETSIMIIYLNLLRNEYDMRQDVQLMEGGKPVIDFIVLSTLINELEQLNFRLQTNEHSLKNEVSNLGEAAKFIHNLNNEVKRYLEFNIYGLDLQSITSNPPNKIFRNFVDITGPILDYKINLEIQEREKQELQKQMYPVGKINKQGALVLQSRLDQQLGHTEFMQPEIAYDEPIKQKAQKKGKKNARGFNNSIQQDMVHVKPSVNRMGITQDLRNFYTKNWKSLMEENGNLDISGLDALMASKGLEKAIYDRIKRSPLDYDVLCTSITNTLRHIIGLRNISRHLRNENFKPNVLLLYCDKPLVHLRSLDRNIRGGGPRNNTFENRNFEIKPQKRTQQIAPRYEGFNNDFGGNQVTAKPETEAVEEISYKHYKVYNGKFSFDLNGKKQKSLDKIELISCSSYEKIIKFSQIARKTSLKTNVSQNDFAKYIDQVIREPKKYMLLTGWLTHNKNQTKAAAYLKKNGSVASNQYSKSCKIFVFPIDALESRWLTQIPIYTTTSKIEMLYMLVYKVKSGPVESVINPEPRPVNTPNAYRLIPGHGKIALKPSNLDRIKERTRITITGHFDDTPHKYSDRAATRGPMKQQSKLQNLLDRAGEIEKVSDALIEQENKLRERKAFGLDGGFKSGRQRSFEGNLINSLQKDTVTLGMDTLLSKRSVLEDRSNYYMEQQPVNAKNKARIDKNEFIKNAVNSIQLPPTHAFLGENQMRSSGGFGYRM